jgi:hypothetical protein
MRAPHIGPLLSAICQSAICQSANLPTPTQQTINILNYGPNQQRQTHPPRGRPALLRRRHPRLRRPHRGPDPRNAQSQPGRAAAHLLHPDRLPRRRRQRCGVAAGGVDGQREPVRAAEHLDRRDDGGAGSVPRAGGAGGSA